MLEKREAQSLPAESQVMGKLKPGQCKALKNGAKVCNRGGKVRFEKK